MKPGLKRGLLIGGGVILVGAIVVANMAKGQGGRQGVQVNDVVQGDISSTVRAPAKVQPETHVKLSANVPGEVVRIAVKEGDWVRKGQFLLELDGTQYRAQLRQSQAALEADVDETDVAAIRVGQTATVKVDALPDTTLTGTVVEIANSPKVTELGTQEQQTNFVVDVMIDHPPSTLRPGMTADVEIKTGTKSGVLHVPIQAVVVRTAEELAKANAKPGRRKGREATATAAEPDPATPANKNEEIKGVFVMVDGVALFRKVRPGISSDTDLEVSGDVKAKEKVITGPNKVL